MRADKPGLPNTWELDLQKVQGGYIIGPQLQTRELSMIRDQGPRRPDNGLDLSMVCMDVFSSFASLRRLD